MERTHVPVLPTEVVEFLKLEQVDGGLFVDCTLGEGGHSALLLEHSPDSRLIGVDADATMIERARSFLGPLSSRVEFVQAWYDEFWNSYSGPRPHRILFDLGISTFHLSASGRGFAFRGDEPLDMRLSDSVRSAAELLENLSQEDLAVILFVYGEERYSRRIAAAILRARDEHALRTTRDLAQTVASAVPAAYRRGRNNPATRTFQAIRIAVNSELERLRAALPRALAALSADGGRMGVITFHSLEDRLVKWAFRAASGDDSAVGRSAVTAKHSNASKFAPKLIDTMVLPAGERVRILTRKPVLPSDEEVSANPASRSAKLRVVEKGTVEESR